MFVLQTTFVFLEDRSFKEGMRQRRELVLQDSVASKVPAQQAMSVASALQETEYEVSSYVRNVLGLSLIFNFAMLIVGIGDRQKDNS